MSQWYVYYKMPNGNSGYWPVYANTKDEAITQAKKEHNTEMNRGAQITRVSPA